MSINVDFGRNEPEASLPLPHPLTVQFGLSSLSFQPAAESETQGREDKSSLIVALISFLKLLLLSIGDTHAPRSSLNTLVINDANGCRSSTLRCYKMFEMSESMSTHHRIVMLVTNITLTLTENRNHYDS